MELSRRNFFIGSAALLASSAAEGKVYSAVGKIPGFDESPDAKTEGQWQPFSDRKVRVGIAGYGVCTFGATFFFQDHPNVEVVAATDLFKDRCEALAKAVRAKRTYGSCEEMLDREKEMDAVFIATDAPSHVQLAIRALNRGFHVASACPTLFGIDQLQYADELIAAVRKSGRKYALYETTAFRPQAYAMRTIYEAGGFGKLHYTEGEYFHFSGGAAKVDSYKGWRDGLPPQYYCTHSNGFYTTVTHKSFTEVTCIGRPSDMPAFQPSANPYRNPYASEIALFKTSEGGSARMAVCWDLPGYHGERGRCYGSKGCYREGYSGDANLVKGLKLLQTALPPGMKPNGHHGGSHPYLTDDFIRAILLDRQPCVDVATALNTTVAGIYAHMSALKGGETLKIPQFAL